MSNTTTLRFDYNAGTWACAATGARITAALPESRTLIGWAMVERLEPTVAMFYGAETDARLEFAANDEVICAFRIRDGEVTAVV